MRLRSVTAAPDRQWLLPLPLLLLAVVLMFLLALPGCSGCWGTDTTADAKKKEDDEKEKQRKRKKDEKPKEDFEPLVMRMLPSNDPTPAVKAPQGLVKPGHWIAVQESAKANNFDFPGELTTFVEQTATNQPLEVEIGSTSRVWNWCPAVLPRGQTKRIEALFYVPRREEGLGSVYSLRSELRGARGGRTEVFTTTISPSLKDYENLILVLAGNSVTPAAYTHFDRLLSVKMPQVEATENEPLRYYHVIRPAIDRSVPLPSYPLAWTTIAYIFWDDLDPALLTNQQQQALLDWLHWGGQLVISGPSSLDKLKGSFLAEQLPAEVTETIKLEQSAFDELNSKFSLERQTVALSTAAVAGQALRRIKILPERPMLGVELNKHPEARDVEGTGGLVVERRVGGGRVVVTRFPLTDVRIKQWKNFDGFFNAVLLRRPGREFSQDQLSMLKVKWTPVALQPMLLEARLGSTLRYFCRDVGELTPEGDEQSVATAVVTPRSIPAPARRPRGGMGSQPVYGSPGMGFGPGGWQEIDTVYKQDTSRVHPQIDDWHFGGYESSLDTGVAGWNDRGAAANAARLALTEAAGIQIPRREFVIQVLGIYLLVLVPANWLIFWTIGRVEWAWVAAPLIAIAGAGAVIRLAQLDIGFARSRTEIAVLEVQGGYERAHLTRFTALYTSLSSSYALAFDEPSALALPFSAGPQIQSLLSMANANFTDVAFRRDKETSLSGVQVSSNSTGMVHSEQMLPLGKNPKLTESILLVGDEQKGYSIRNTTDITLRDVGVFRRVNDPAQAGSPRMVRIEAAYVAKLEAATSAPIRFSSFVASNKSTENSYPTVWLPEWNQSQAFAARDADQKDSDKGHVRLTRLAKLAAQRLELFPGDARLVAWTDEPLPGLQINPEAPQNRTFTLIVAHLARGPLPGVKPDNNVAEDFVDPTFFDDPAAPEPAEAIDATNSNP